VAFAGSLMSRDGFFIVVGSFGGGGLCRNLLCDGTALLYALTHPLYDRTSPLYDRTPLLSDPTHFLYARTSLLYDRTCPLYALTSLLLTQTYSHCKRSIKLSSLTSMSSFQKRKKTGTYTIGSGPPSFTY
jgi:hypothetical protein